MEDSYEEYYWHVVNLLDDEAVFEEFGSNANNVNGEFTDATNDFIIQLDKDTLTQFTYSITAMIVINILCQTSNKNNTTKIGLIELDVFNAYFEHTIDLAKELSAHTGCSVNDCLLYGFIYANFLIQLADNNKEILKTYKKDVIKPIKKLFKRDYYSALKLRRNNI